MTESVGGQWQYFWRILMMGRRRSARMKAMVRGQMSLVKKAMISTRVRRAMMREPMMTKRERTVMAVLRVVFWRGDRRFFSIWIFWLIFYTFTYLTFNKILG